MKFFATYLQPPPPSYPGKYRGSTLNFSTIVSMPIISNSLFFANPNFVARVRERTILTERPPLVGEVSANFCG
jgi:hypothetical protein